MELAYNIIEGSNKFLLESKNSVLGIWNFTKKYRSKGLNQDSATEKAKIDKLYIVWSIKEIVSSLSVFMVLSICKACLLSVNCEFTLLNILLCRFYFVGDEDLLEIIGNSKNIPRLQKHFKKMFAGVASIVLNEDDSLVVCSSFCMFIRPLFYHICGKLNCLSFP